MSKKTEFWTIVWDIVKFILTLGISHINKRKEKLSSNEFTPGQLETAQRLQTHLNRVSKIGNDGTQE